MKRINLALQGGGAHGAYTWGVLDKILEHEDIEIASMSGTSAGALNAAALKAGLIKNGRQGARDMLSFLWGQIAGIDDFRIPSWMTGYVMTPGQLSKTIEMSVPYMWADVVSRMMTPYAWGPFYKNPLEHIVQSFDFDCVCADAGPELFICATNVRSGKVKVFEGDEVTSDVLLASACLPTLFQAVEIEDPATGQVEAYWDGGYTGNPALFPMFEPRLPNDIVIVNINPIIRDEVPKTPQEIQNRINEISFNASLLRELRAISFVQELIHEGRMPPNQMKDVYVHMIADDKMMTNLSVATKLVPTPYVIQELRDAGRDAAEQFLAQHKDKLNQQSSVDLPLMFS
ncbi:patatin-like phospholipase family protein [Donghicola mangrovi]|uniref:Patatin-like phospholipase family protein n=1 Tax=Donghicola mangrovi TaxID=2729614 RepID=A0A850Q9H7_9RHOB|nr:patatin-like phospholipase family protein [Donghicola mangrovi]NVO22949.1 patatin-like phospholipase family protein [Donghicola mangrovi]